MTNKQDWFKPELSCYGSIENITEQFVGSVTKTAGSGDTITITVGGNVVSTTSGTAAGSSLINITPPPTN